VGLLLAVVTVDERGRLTIPKDFQVRDTRATIIPSGSFFMVIPLPAKPLEITGHWLGTKLERSALKAQAEKAAGRDAIKRAKRRKQL
jgi:hypothetical protein